jgi:Gp49-like protein DUF891
MPFKVLFRGVRYTVALWLDEDEACAVEDFILDLYAENDPDAEAMTYELEKTSQRGPSPNKEKFRYLKGTGQGLVEFKARGGSRVLGFIDQPRRRIVCTHGVPKLKKKRFEREIDKAQQISDTYLIETEEGKHVN